MRFEILNVEHGFCAYAVGSDGGVLLFGLWPRQCKPPFDLPSRPAASPIFAGFSSPTTTRTTSATCLPFGEASTSRCSPGTRA